jgi:hypothetical protein
MEAATAQSMLATEHFDPYHAMHVIICSGGYGKRTTALRPSVGGQAG